jgi:hypothetical protein
MVKDKINYRARGPRTMLTRQTVQGRANDGGLRIGEMERDGIIAHGASCFLKESMLVRGDDYYVAVCNHSGTIAIYNREKNIFLSPLIDGPIEFTNEIDNTKKIEVISKYGRNFSVIRVPYSFKLLIQELQTMNIQMRIITDKNIEQFRSMNLQDTIDLYNRLKYITQKYPEQVTDEIKLTDEVMEEDKDDDSDLSPITREAVRVAEEYAKRLEEEGELKNEAIKISDDNIDIDIDELSGENSLKLQTEPLEEEEEELMTTDIEAEVEPNKEFGIEGEELGVEGEEQYIEPTREQETKSNINKTKIIEMQ